MSQLHCPSYLCRTVEVGQFAPNLVDQQVLHGSAASWPMSLEHDIVSTTETGATDPTPSTGAQEVSDVEGIGATHINLARVCC